MKLDGAVLDRPDGEIWTAPIEAPSIVPSQSPACGDLGRNDTRPVALPRCPEIDCVRHLIPPGPLAMAELRALEIGVGADRVLIAEGLIDEEAYLAEVSKDLSIPFETLHDQSRDACPIDDAKLITALGTGMIPLRSNHDDIAIIIAPRELSIRQLYETQRSGSDLVSRVRLTSNSSLASFANRHLETAVGYRAAEGLRSEHPEMSAGTGRRRSVAVTLVMTAIALVAIVGPGLSAIVVELALGLVFLAWTALRLLGLVALDVARKPTIAVEDKNLPIYTIVIALYREAATVEDLVGSLRKLNYPLEKLDIKLVLEPDDTATQSAVAKMKLTAPFDVIIAPDVEPRTKPKALNAALPFARGKFIVVYDAEDRPEPDQLRLALDAFTEGDRKLACVQARLTIDNTSDGWLTRMFTAEYAGLFDVFLPGLAAWRLPLPLGGSSNHFRIDILRKIGAWDPYNVTEDADLGMRLARLGYRTAMIQSTTYEEAPARFGPWLRQRTRWCKGWIQTWLVHMRDPLKLKAELGWIGFVVFQLIVGGTVLAALVHSLFVAKLALEFTTAALFGSVDDVTAMAPHAYFLAAGYLISILLGVVGLARRRLLGCAWVLALIPLYWIMLSLAAWRAMFQLVRDPYRWEKTEHGLAQSSRLAQRLAAQASQKC